MDRDVMQRSWDVIVIGAGPAGAMAGLLLARSGLDVLIVERQAFPRAKVCGGCLNGHATGVLRRAGVLDALVAAGGRRYDSLVVRSGGKEARLQLPEGLAMSRFAMDDIVSRAAVAAGCSLVTGFTATIQPEDGTARDSGVREVLIERADRPPEIATGRVVIAADGLSRRSLRLCPEFAPRVWARSRVGLGAVIDGDALAVPDGAILMAVGREGYVGAVRVESGVSVAAAVDPARLKADGAARCVSAILRGAGVVLRGELDHVHWLGTPPLTQHLARPVGHRLLVLGDAAGYVEPFTGEGMAWAVMAAESAVPFVREGCRTWDARLEERWLRAFRRTVGREQRWCRAVSRSLRWPGAAAVLVGALRVEPGLARPVLKHLTP